MHSSLYMEDATNVKTKQKIKFVKDFYVVCNLVTGNKIKIYITVSRKNTSNDRPL